MAGMVRVKTRRKREMDQGNKPGGVQCPSCKRGTLMAAEYIDPTDRADLPQGVQTRHGHCDYCHVDIPIVSHSSILQSMHRWTGTPGGIMR
jgi:hypothetical protein